MSEFVLIGQGGMLGRQWATLLSERGIDHVAPARADLDLQDDDVSHLEDPEQTYHRILARQ